MDGIREVKTSFERLLKVWLSKLDVAEEDLVADDMIWFSETFDDFFTGSNLKEFINRDGRYQNRLEFDQIDFSQLLNSSIDYSNRKEERWSRLKVEKPSQFEYYRQLNEFNSENYKNYNIIDIYFRILKKLYSTASEKELERTKNIVLSRVLSTVHKVSVFEKKDFDSISLLSDFYYGVLKGLFTKKEIINDLPDEEFLKTVLFVPVFNVYYLPLFSYRKTSLLRKYLLNTWIYLNGLGKNNLIDNFLNSLSDMTLSNSSYKEIDLYHIRDLLKREDRDLEFYQSLESVKTKGGQIILLRDLEEYTELIKKVSKNEVPDYLPKNLPEYFLKVEEDDAIKLYKFRAMQTLVLEYLSIVLHFRDKDFFIKAFNRLRKNEQWSNHRTFFPKSINDVLVWLILFSELKREMNFKIEPSFGYKFLDEIIIFLFKDIAFDERSMRNILGLRGLLLNSSFLNSMSGVSDDLLNRIADSNLLNDEDKSKSLTFWRSMVSLFNRQIGQIEIVSPIESQVFEGLVSKIITFYKEKSLLYFLSKKLSKFDRKVVYKNNVRTFVVASDLPLRKYVIPDWFSPAYGLSESIGGYLIEEENMQFDYNFFSKKIPIKKQVLQRGDVLGIVDQHKKDCLFVFRNSYPDFWIQGQKSKTNSKDLTSPVTFTYNTFDRNSELIVIPKSSMSVRYVFDGRFSNLEFYDNTLMWELLDLGGGHEDNLLKVRSIKGFVERFNLTDEELKKHFWIRFVAKAKAVIKDSDSILRFKLDPYGN